MAPAEREDQEDLQAAQAAADHHSARKEWYQRLGPGLITGAADDDPSGIGTYSSDGAQFGYGLLWLVPFSVPLMIAVQEMCGRIGVITGKGLAAILKTHYPKWLLFICVLLLGGANIFNIYADLNVMAASAGMLSGVSFNVVLPAITFILVALQILVPYHRYVKILKWLCISLLGYVVVAFLPGVKNNWREIAKALFTPHIKLDSNFMLALTAFLGTTISPYLFFWQTSETVEEEIAEGNVDTAGDRLTPVKLAEIRNVRTDTIFGMCMSQAIAFFIMISTTGTLHIQGITHINTAQDAAKALLPLGPAAYWIFALCMIGTGLLAIPTLAGSTAYALSETFGWRYGLFRRFARAKAFYLAITAVILLGYGINYLGAISPIKALVYSAAINGIVAPPLIIVLLSICNNAAIVGRRTNGKLSNIFGWAAAILMGTAAVYMIYGWITGAGDSG